VIFLKYEYKSFHIEVKEIDKTGTFVGLASPYNNVDDGNDRCLPSIGPRNNQKTVPMLWQHDPHSPIGSLLLTDTPKGIQVNGTLTLDKDDDKQYMVPKAAEGYALLKKGLLKLSIGYQTLDFKYVTENNQTIRDLLDINIMEVSLVTFPMNSQSVVSSVKNKNIGSDNVKIKGVIGSTKLPLADAKAKWDSSSATKNVLESYKYGDGNISEDVKNAFFYSDDKEYKCGFTDIIDGNLMAIPEGIRSVAKGLKENSLKLDDAERKEMISKVNVYLKKLGDDEIEEAKEPVTGAKSKKNPTEHKALSFNAVFQTRQNREARWDAESALDNSLDSIVQDEDMDTDAKITAINNSVDGFAAMYKTIFSGLVNALASQKSSNFKYETKEAYFERKAGKKISKVNKDKLQHCKDGIDDILPLLTELLGDDCEDEPDGDPDDNQDDSKKSKNLSNQQEKENDDTLELKSEDMQLLEGLSKYFKGDEE
jgi:HK97 family phage prohead protease